MTNDESLLCALALRVADLPCECDGVDTCLPCRADAWLAADEQRILAARLTAGILEDTGAVAYWAADRERRRSHGLGGSRGVRAE